MLQAAGGRRPAEEREDSGFRYYSRHFRACNGSTPEALGPLQQYFEGVSILTLPSDNDTWAVSFVTSAHDPQTPALREPALWERALARFPTLAHWGAGEPITDVQAIAGIEDRHCGYVVDDRPVVTGLLAVGDAWACTNRSAGAPGSPARTSR